MYNPELTNNISYNKCSTDNYIYIQYMIFTNIHNWKTFHKTAHIRKKRKYLTDFNNFLTISQQNETSVPIGTQLSFYCWCPCCLFFFTRIWQSIAYIGNTIPKMSQFEKSRIPFKLGQSKLFSYIQLFIHFALSFNLLYTLSSSHEQSVKWTDLGLIFDFENKKNIFSRKNKYANIAEKSQLMILPI